MSELRLSLVAMPWAHRSRPSGALAALAAFVRLRLPEIATTVHHEFVEVSEILGEPVYAAISDECYRIGEMLYATLLYPSQVDTGRAAFHAWAHERLPAADDRTFDVVREGLKAHLESLASRLAETSDAIGFSCSFGQLFASILVARGVKERNPGCRIVLGGSSVSSLAGPSLLQEYPWVDQVIQGEGEQPLEALLRAAQRGILGEPAWAADARFDTFAGRKANENELDEHLGAWAAARDAVGTAAWLQKHGVPAAAAVDPRTMQQHPQYVARRFYEPLDHPELGTQNFATVPFRFASVDRWLRAHAPTLGQHNREILQGVLGVTDAEYAQLEADGIVGTRPKGT